MLHTPTHLHHILHNLLDRGILYGHVDRAHRDHKVESRDDVASILN